MNQKVFPHLLPGLSPEQLPRQLRTALPGLTVVITNVNQVDMLPQAIRSALAVIKTLRPQNIPADVLVIDNASRDGSMTLLRQLEAVYFEAGLRVFALPQPISLPAMRNFSLVQARYRTILLGNADVTFVAENIGAFYQAVQETEAATIYGNFSHHKPGSATNTPANMGHESPPWLQAQPINSFAFYDRLQIFDTGGFAENQTSEDHKVESLWSHLSACGRKQLFLPLLLGIYHERANTSGQLQLPSHPPIPYYPDRGILSI